MTLPSDCLCPLSFHSMCPLHRAQRLRASPVFASHPEAECASGLVPHPAGLPLECSAPGQERAGRPPPTSCPHCGCQSWGWIDGWGLVCSQKEPEQERQGKHCSPDVTVKSSRGFSVCQLALYFSAAQPAKQPTHCRLQSTGPQAQGATMRGRFTCVPVCMCAACPWAFTWASVCLCVCVGGSRGLGNWEWEPPDCNSGCYLGNPGGKEVLNEWVGEGSTVDACVRGTWLCLWI